MGEVFVGRQPICDSALEVAAFELLYRSDGENRAKMRDGDAAFACVAMNTLADVGLERLVGNRPAYINATERVLVDQLYKVVPPESMVIEVLESVLPSDKVVAAIRRARGLGYRIALDDFVPGDPRASMLDLADVIKVDLERIDHSELQAFAKSLQHPQRKLLAEKVEAWDVFRKCKTYGYELFQGYFFCVPEIVRKKTLHPDRLTLLRLFVRLQDVNATIEELEELVQHDPGLSYKILRLVNSALYSTVREVESIRHAVALLGLHRVRECVAMLLLALVEEKPSELLREALARAALARLIAQSTKRADPEKCYTAGLLSLLDAVMDMPLDVLLAQLPMLVDVRVALLERTGEIGRILNGAVACERSDVAQLETLGFDIPMVQAHFLDALDFSRDALLATS